MFFRLCYNYSQLLQNKSNYKLFEKFLNISYFLFFCLLYRCLGQTYVRHDALELVGYQANKNLGEEHGACAYVMSRCVDNREIFGNMLKSISDLFEGLMIFDKMHDDLGRATSHQWSSHFTLVTVPDPSTLLNNSLIILTANHLNYLHFLTLIFTRK